MGQLRAAATIAAADLRRRLRNRSFLVQAVVAPIVLASLISLAFAGSDDLSSTVGIADDDGSSVGAAFVEGATAASAGDLEFTEVASGEAARRGVDAGDLDAAVVVPEGFAASLAGDRPGEVIVVTRPDRTVSAEVADAVARTFTARADGARLAAATTVAGGGTLPGEAELAAIELPVEVTQQDAGDDVSPATYFGPSMGLLFLFLAVGAAARDLLADKRTRRLDRLRASPVRDGTILAGKGASSLALGLVSLLVIWLVTGLGLGADWGDPVGVALLIATSALMVAAFAGFVAAVARTEQAADTLASVVAFAFALLGGNFIPLGDMPDLLRTVSLFTPNGWALRGFAELSAGDGGVVDVIPHIGMLLVWTAVAATVATVLLPRRMEGS